jgi:hypothetical protein
LRRLLGERHTQHPADLGGERARFDGYLGTAVKLFDDMDWCVVGDVDRLAIPNVGERDNCGD